jgi:hypothetical protein
MVACTAARETTNHPDDEEVIGDLVNMWVIVQAFEDMPATPETNASYAKASQLLDERLERIGLDPTRLRKFFDGPGPDLLLRRLQERAGRSREATDLRGSKAIGKEVRVEMAHSKTTGKKAASAASAVLRNPRSSTKAKSAAASALSQTHGKGRRGAKKGR